MKLLNSIFMCILFVCINQYIYAQNYRFIQGSEEDYSIDLNLYPDSSYTLISRYHPPKSSLTMMSIIALGDFSISKNVYLLSDRINSYRMTLLSLGDTLYTEKGFIWMKNGYFILKDINAKNDVREYANSMPQKSKICTLRKELESKQKTLNPLIYGTYYSEEFFKIIIEENESYSIYRYNSVFSEGYWKRKGNILLLYDKEVGGPFSMFIHNDSSLTSFAIPFDYLMRNFTMGTLEYYP